MSTTPLTTLPGHKPPHEDYLNATYGIRSWLLTTDHKRIALLWLGSVTFFFFIGGIFAPMIRIHLLTPTRALLTPETYNKLFTMPGVAMIFFFLIPSIPAVLRNFLLPLMICANELAIPLLVAGLDRMFQLGFFNSALGGDSILFQHLFWFYSHPAVYIMVLPAMGVVSEIIPTFARKPIFGYSFIAGSSIAIAVIGFLVWAHHMFVTADALYPALPFSLPTHLYPTPPPAQTSSHTP